ncbi:MAG: murein hydrolase activator EnvC family protein [Crocinitomicaceae bacterium]|jgi:septal ring factor EnvC (AmiA/AmiB activator)
MKNVSSLLFFLFCFGLVNGQSSQEKLKKEQQKLEKRISNTKSLLSKVKNNSKASLNELRLIDNQIKSREALVRIFDNQVRMAEIKMVEKQQEVKRLKKRLSDLKRQYKKMVLYAYKHRSNYGRIMFLLSANNYNEALKRNRYLKKVAGVQRKQAALIKQHQDLIAKEITSISSEKDSKFEALQEKKKERELIGLDKSKKEKSYEKIKKEEQNLLAQLQADERKKAEVKQRIDAALKQEIAKEQAKQRERDKAKKDQSKKESNTKASNTKATTTTTKTTSKTTTNTTKTDNPAPKQVTYTESTEGSAVGKNFESNRGRLPWPVEKGSITERYGTNPHPTLAGVFTNNNGIDITCPKSSRVRSVFEGEVTSVFSINGAGKFVVIKHGAYRTVYGNLQETYVSVGTKVSSKQSIGSLLVDGSGVSICHFEIHSVAGGLTKSLNPSLWIGR